MLFKSLTCLFIVILLGLSSTAQAGSAQETINKLDGYFVKNTVKFDDNYNFMHMVITSQEEFEDFFGMAKTMQNKIEKVNFAENNVIAIMTKPSDITKKIELVYHEFNGDQLFVKYAIIRGDKSTFISTGLYLATIPKNISRVKFQSRYNVGIIEVK